MLIYGKEIREQLKEDLLKLSQSQQLNLSVVQVGYDEASLVYTKNIRAFGESLGIRVDVHNLPEEATNTEAENLITGLNRDPQIHGILLQKPLPQHLDANKLTDLVDYGKDVEGIHNFNLGKLLSRQPGVKPSTPKAVIRMLKHFAIPIAGKLVTIVGRSTILGGPLSVMMTSEDGTVTLCHSKTADLKNEIGRADILIAAMGRINYITPDMVKPGGVIIDAGINFDEHGKMFGDVHEEAKAKAAYASAVPGGIGVITVAELFDNLFVLQQL